MSDIDVIMTKLDSIIERLDDVESRMIAPKQITTVGGLSDITEFLGTVSAGEFRAGIGTPGQGFTGTRIVYPGVVYDGETWTVCGVNDDKLMVGFRSSDGKIVAGAGAVELDREGIKVADNDGYPVFTVLATDATINDEVLTAGDMLIGKNSGTDPNILWDKSAGKMYIRKGTVAGAEIDGGTVKSYGARAIYYESTGFPYGSSEWGAVSFNIEDYDDADFFDSDAPTKFTIPAGMAGTYQIGIHANWPVNEVGDRVASLGINGTYWYNPTDVRRASTNESAWQCATHERTLSSGDYLELYLQQQSGGSLDLGAASMWIRKVR